MDSSTIAILGLIVIGLILVALLRARKRESAWSIFARRIGLEYKEPSAHPVVSGKFGSARGIYRSRAMRLEVQRREVPGYEAALSILSLLESGAPYTKTLFTYIQRDLGLRGSDQFSLQIHRRGAPLPKGLKTGDDELDRRFRFESNNPDYASLVLRSQMMRERLLEIQDFDGSLKVDPQGLHYEVRGIVQNLDRLHSLFDLLSDISEIIETLEVGSG